MSTQDVSGAHAFIAFPGEDHEHESACTNIFDVVPQMRVLLRRSGKAKQRTLKLSQESVFLTGGIETLNVSVPVQNIDVLSIEPGLQQRVDGRVGIRGVGDGSDDAIGGVRNEIRSLFRRIHGPSDPIDHPTSKARLLASVATETATATA